MSWKVLITARTLHEVGANAIALLQKAGLELIYPPRFGPLKEDELLPRLEAMDALGNLGPAAWTSLPALRKAEQDENPYIRNSAKAAIAKIMTKQTGP